MLLPQDLPLPGLYLWALTFAPVILAGYGQQEGSGHLTKTHFQAFQPTGAHKLHFPLFHARPRVLPCLYRVT